jgi:fructokinase
VVGGDQLADVDQVGVAGEATGAFMDRHAPIVHDPHVACSPVGGVILVAGEALIDLVPDAEASTLAAHPGGGPFNAARTIGRPERPVAYLGRLSRDRFGQRMQRLLAEDGVGLDAIVRTDEPTTLALADVDEQGVARYRFYTEGTAAAGLTPEAALAARPDEVRVVHAGTLGLVLEPVASALEAVIERLSRHALVFIDPNIRPDIIGDAGAYRARLKRILGMSHVVKVSEEDLDWIAPGRRSVDAVRELLADGPAVGLLTRGPSGALVITRTAEVAVPSPRTEVVDTIGAGDAFGGGFVAWWHANGLGRDDLAHIDAAVSATGFACLIAARTCARAGASPPRLSELDAGALA